MFIRLHTIWTARGKANRRGMERAIEMINSKSWRPTVPRICLIKSIIVVANSLRLTE